MFPDDMYALYNSSAADIETVHPYLELAIKSLNKHCAKDGINSNNQHKYVIGKLSEVIIWYAGDNVDTIRNLQSLH